VCVHLTDLSPIIGAVEPHRAIPVAHRQEIPVKRHRQNAVGPNFGHLKLAASRKFRASNRCNVTQSETASSAPSGEYWSTVPRFGVVSP